MNRLDGYFETEGDLILKRLRFGIKILYRDFSPSLFFPTSDASKGGLLLILQRNKNLPREGYGASIYERGYRHQGEFKPGILLREYNYDGRNFQVMNKYFIDTKHPISEEEMRSDSFEEYIKKAREEGRLIPINEISSQK